MKHILFYGSKSSGATAALYPAIVAQARSAAFYRSYGVPDTVPGRLEMLLLHTFLFCRRANTAEGKVRSLGQSVFDAFCRDIDDNLREMGVGDLAVPKHMQRIGEAFYGRAAAYESALAQTDKQALAEALTRNVYSGKPTVPEAVSRLSAYILMANGMLAQLEDAALAQGQIRFPDPETIAA